MNKKVLCLCSYAQLRSPTIARVLHELYGHETVAHGIRNNTVDVPLIEWADEIVCADAEHLRWIAREFPGYESKAVCLYIPDEYNRDSPALVRLILERYRTWTELTPPPLLRRS